MIVNALKIKFFTGKYKYPYVEPKQPFWMSIGIQLVT